MTGNKLRLKSLFYTKRSFDSIVCLTRKQISIEIFIWNKKKVLIPISDCPLQPEKERKHRREKNPNQVNFVFKGRRFAAMKWHSYVPPKVHWKVWKFQQPASPPASPSSADTYIEQHNGHPRRYKGNFDYHGVLSKVTKKQVTKVDKPARLSFSWSLDLLLISIKQK